MKATPAGTVLLWFLLLPLPVSAAPEATSGDEGRSHYVLRQKHADVGSHIPRELAMGSLVPFDKTYSQLTAEEKARLRSLYEDMPADDEPPFPRNGLKEMIEAMSTILERLAVGPGVVDLVVTVDNKGVGQSVQVLQASDPEVANMAAKVLLLTPYKTAICKGQPCQMQYPFRMQFVVR